MFNYEEIVKKNLRINSKFLEKHDISQTIMLNLARLENDLADFQIENSQITFLQKEKENLFKLYCNCIGRKIAVLINFDIEVENLNEIINKMHKIFVGAILAKKIVSDFKTLGPIAKSEIDTLVKENFFISLCELLKDKKITQEKIKKIENVITGTKYPLNFSSSTDNIIAAIICSPILLFLIYGMIAFSASVILNITLSSYIILLIIFEEKCPINAFHITTIVIFCLIFFSKGIYNVVQLLQMIF